MATSIREKLNQSPGLMMGIAAAVVAVAVFLVVMQILGSRRKFADKLPDAWFTVDDGKTFFAANSANVPPFDHKGQQAVRAYVFECGGERFVVYLERFTPEAHKAMVENTATPQHQMYGRELKKPGDTKWTSSRDDAGVSKAQEVACPHGGAHTPEPIEP